ncbi:MAG: AAA family ATPase, partial [Pseudomonadales bacterium]|nr:AAA family ATPase [Pseudomonadales bacterium]
FARTNFDINTDDDAFEAIHQLVNRYIKYEKPPGSLVKFYNRCLKQAFNNNRQVITQPDVIQEFVDYTGLPELFLRDDKVLDFVGLNTYFRERIIGQDAVLEQLCHIVQLFKAGLNDPQKPIATLLFAGPTGVGKTAAAKALAEYFFNAGQSKHPLFRLDMSEFQHPWHIDRLIGSESKNSALIQHVRANPFSVVLFDEIEKAHSSVFDALLTTLDEGLLTDRFGRTTDFRNTIIIMTTNLGVSRSNPMGFAEANSSASVSINVIKDFFRPEFFNRIDATLAFAPLSQESIFAITRRELEAINKRERLEELKISLNFSDNLLTHIAQTGYSETYGARPIQRTIERLVVNALAEYFIQHKTVGNRIFVDWRDDQVVIGKEF